MTRFIPLIIAALVASGCAYAPPGAGSHARFVRTSGREAARVGTDVHAVATKDSFAAPYVRGSLVEPLTASYDASLVVTPGQFLYEGLARFGPENRLGVLHGLGLGYPILSVNEQLGLLGATAGIFVDLGVSLYTAAFWSGQLTVMEGSTELANFAAVELGAVLGENMQFSPVVTAILPFSEYSSGYLILLGVAFNIDY